MSRGGMAAVAAVLVAAVAAPGTASGQRTPARAATPAAPARDSTLTDVRWRHIGPAAFGGRISELAVDPTDHATIYIGAASGGIFKSTNGGTTWRPIFDASGGAQSIGALTIAPSDPQVIWVGTGEANNRQSSSWGNGVFRSTDGGRTWQHRGLAETHHIGRIVVHPDDPATAWVAAVGRLWGPNAERGVYRTRDGGATWQRVLTIDAETGATDLVLDPDGRTLTAASYQRRRRAFGFVGGGMGSGIHRSTDGGDTWQRLGDAAGIPAGPIGRVGLTQAPSDPRVLYAVIEHRTRGGVYRSADRGLTWERRNPLNPRPMYYSNVRVNPHNPDHVWLLDAYLFESRDGGKTFASDSTGEGIHVDHHALWIDPTAPAHMLLGNDGGLYETHDGARSWRFLDNLPIGQYYDIAVDDREPYRIYGGTQDNGTWALPSRTYNQGGIFNDDILHLAYGDGFHAIPDPTDPRYVYANSQNGRAYVVDTETAEQRLIRPAPADTGEVYRFTWSTPVLVSPHDPRTYYYGGHRLFRTRDRGVSWETVSPDLSRREAWEKLPIMGVIRDSTTLSRDDGVSDYGTLTTISESPLAAGWLLVGTDDGLVHRSVDGGKTWSDLTSRFRLPGPRWVSRVLASRHDARTAYVAFDGHQDDDFAPYLFVTRDGGESWRALGGGIPAGFVINAVAEHPDDANLLLVGTESGLVVTYDAGATWKVAGGNLPPVPIDDIVVHERTRDIVLGTHGRSLIVLDDARFMAGGDPSRRGAVTLAQPGPATMAYRARAIPSAGAGRYAGENPEPGALITYTVGAGAGGDSLTLTIRGDGGGVVHQRKVAGSAGVHRVTWEPRHPLPYTPVAADAVWFGPPKGAWVLPGKYAVTLEGSGAPRSVTLEVRGDPRANAPIDALRERHVAGLAVHELLRSWNDADRALATLARDAASSGAERDTTQRPIRELAALRETFRSGWLSLKSRILDLHGAVQGASAAPTTGQQRTLAALHDEMTREVGRVNALLEAWEGWRAERREGRGVPEKVRAPRKEGE